MSLINGRKDNLIFEYHRCFVFEKALKSLRSGTFKLLNNIKLEGNVCTQNNYSQILMFRVRERHANKTKKRMLNVKGAGGAI